MTAGKACCRCLTEKPLSDFGVLTKRGKTYPDSWCRLCRRAYSRDLGRKPLTKKRQRAYGRTHRKAIRENAQERRKVNRVALNKLKKAPCTDCGRQYPIVCMDFDHLDGFQKRRNVGRMLDFSWGAILQEVAKCELVCANCHRVRTGARMVYTSSSKRAQKVLDFRSKINSLKADPCVDCDHQFDPLAMDFDHVRGEKRYCISQMAELSWTRVLAKCELVCANCHRIRTEARS